MSVLLLGDNMNTDDKDKEVSQEQRIINTEPRHIPLEEWLNNREGWIKLFGVRAVRNGIKLAQIGINDLTDIKQLEREPNHYNPRMMVKGWHVGRIKRFLTHNGLQYEAWEDAQVQDWRVKAQYQGLKHSKIIKAILSDKLSFFDKFAWECYSFDYEKDYEIYMQTENGSLYVPVSALLKGDVDAIKKRNITYWTSYRKGSTYNLNKKAGESFEEFTARKELEYAEDIKPLQSKEAKKLFKILGV